MKKIIWTVLLFFVVLFPGWILYAGPDNFTQADKNGDEIISKDEFESRVRSRFNEYDRNKDGRLDIEEFGSGSNPEVVKEFKFMDRNSDGFVNADEFYRAALQKREEMDFNRDGRISREEYNSYKALPVLKFYF